MDFRALRAKMGLTQSEAATKFGVTRQTWQNWEAGREVSGPALALASILENDALLHVANLRSATDGDAWEHVGLYRSVSGQYFLSEQGGKDSSSGHKHGANIHALRQIDSAEAQRLLPTTIP